MHFLDLFSKKCRKTGKMGQIVPFSFKWGNVLILTRFSHFSAFFAKQIQKTHKITSYFYDVRIILMEKFWSHGTPLGSLGPGSQEALGLGPRRFQILVIWGPYDPPVPLLFQTHAKNPNTAGAWCVVRFR